MRATILFILLLPMLLRAEPDFPLTEDSKPQPDVPKGELLKGSHTAKESSVFPGTQREYTLYLPPGIDKTKPAPFMVFQDGVIYQAPVVFDNLIARKEIPPLVGIFVKPGVVPAANDNALPRYNRSYEYDSVTDTYARFLIEELLPTIEQKHGLQLSTDPNDAAISGNSSGGIAAFMVAWHRPDRFRRVFTGVGTYVGIRGADQLPVLVRKVEPKPIKVFLQSGTGDNNLYCGDWWMANQMMERSLTWAGYDVNHAWGEGGHNQKHASQIFPDVLRWLWKGWPEAKEVKANPRGESKWKGYEVCVQGAAWDEAAHGAEGQTDYATMLAASPDGMIFFGPKVPDSVIKAEWEAAKKEPFARAPSPYHPCAVGSISADGSIGEVRFEGEVRSFLPLAHGEWLLCEKLGDEKFEIVRRSKAEREVLVAGVGTPRLAMHSAGDLFAFGERIVFRWPTGRHDTNGDKNLQFSWLRHDGVTVGGFCLSPDQSLIYVSDYARGYVYSVRIGSQGWLGDGQRFFLLESSNGNSAHPQGLCVDTEGRLYVATSLGIQVCDQAGRVNFIIPTPQQPYDVCFGGKDLGELFIACGDKIYKRPTKVHGIVSGQMPPIKPAAPKL